MRTMCSGASLAVEAARLRRISRDRRAQQLDRDLAVELAVTGAPNDAHTAFADLVEQVVAGGHHRHRRSSAPLALSTGSGTATTPAFGGVTLPRLSSTVTLRVGRNRGKGGR